MIYLSDKLVQQGVKLGIIVGENIIAEKTFSLDKLKQQIVAETVTDWSREKLLSDSIIAEYRALHLAAIGEKGNDFVSSPEYLINFILNNRKIYNINNIVDCYNLISIKTRVAIGAHDLEKVEGKLKIDVLTGNERFIPLGLGKEVKVLKNAYAFSDDNDILCLFESRQADKTKITPDTKKAIFYLQGNKETTEEYLHQTTQELLSLLQQFCKGEFKIIL